MGCGASKDSAVNATPDSRAAECCNSKKKKKRIKHKDEEKEVPHDEIEVGAVSTSENPVAEVPSTVDETPSGNAGVVELNARAPSPLEQDNFLRSEQVVASSPQTEVRTPPPPVEQGHDVPQTTTEKGTPQKDEPERPLDSPAAENETKIHITAPSPLRLKNQVSRTPSPAPRVKSAAGSRTSSPGQLVAECRTSSPAQSVSRASSPAPRLESRTSSPAELVPESRTSSPAQLVANSRTSSPAQLVTESRTLSPAQLVAESRNSSPAQLFAESRTSSPAQLVANSRTSSPAQLVAESRNSSPAQLLAESRTSSPAQLLAESRTSSPAQLVAKSRTSSPAPDSRTLSPAQLAAESRTSSPAHVAESRTSSSAQLVPELRTSSPAESRTSSPAQSTSSQVQLVNDFKGQLNRTPSPAQIALSQASRTPSPAQSAAAALRAIVQSVTDELAEKAGNDHDVHEDEAEGVVESSAAEERNEVDALKKEKNLEAGREADEHENDETVSPPTDDLTASQHLESILSRVEVKKKQQNVAGETGSSPRPGLLQYYLGLRSGEYKLSSPSSSASSQRVSVTGIKDALEDIDLTSDLPDNVATSPKVRSPALDVESIYNEIRKLTFSEYDKLEDTNSNYEGSIEQVETVSTTKVQMLVDKEQVSSPLSSKDSVDEGVPDAPSLTNTRLSSILDEYTET